MRRFALGLLVVLVASVVGGTGFVVHYRYLKVYHGYDPLPFSKQAWASAGAEQRGHMVRDLLDRHKFRGASRDQVIQLVGRPDYESEALLAYEVGYMGFNSNAPMVFSYTLLFDLAGDGTVKDVGVHD